MADHSSLASILAMGAPAGAAPSMGMLPGGQLAQYLARMRMQGQPAMPGAGMPGRMPGGMPPQLMPGLGSLQGVVPR